MKTWWTHVCIVFQASLRLDKRNAEARLVIISRLQTIKGSSHFVFAYVKTANKCV